MDRYLFSSDLDGTLLNEEHQLSENTVQHVRALVNEGHIFVLNTGRPYQGMLHFKEQLNVDCPYVCDNGASIYWDNHPDFPVFFPTKKELVQELFGKLHDLLVCAMLTAHRKYYFQNRQFVPSFLVHIDEQTIIREGKIQEIVDEDILSITAHVKRERLKDFENVLRAYPSLRTRFWGEYDGICAFDIYSEHADKGLALTYLKEYFHMPPNHTLGFGDELNDAELLRHADYGIAMCNACEELKKLSDDITEKPHYEDGVCDYIFKFLENTRKKV